MEPPEAVSDKFAVSNNALSFVTVIPSDALNVVVPVRFLIVPFS